MCWSFLERRTRTRNSGAGIRNGGKYFLLRGNDPVAWMVCVILGFAEPHLVDQHGDFPAVCSGDSADCIARPLLDSNFEVQAVGGAFALAVLLLATGYLIFGPGYASPSWEPATFLIHCRCCCGRQSGLVPRATAWRSLRLPAFPCGGPTAETGHSHGIPRWRKLSPCSCSGSFWRYR